MNATISADGRQLTLLIPLDDSPPLSSTGRSEILASTRGWQTLDLNGRSIKLSLTVVEPLRGRARSATKSDYYSGGDNE